MLFYKIALNIEKYLEDAKEDPELTGWDMWFVIDKQNHTIIGDIGFKGNPNLKHAVEIGYGIASSAQNKGYATEAYRI